MFDRPYQVLRGRVSNSSVSRGSLSFSVDGVRVDMDVPGSTQPFSDGERVELVVRRGMLLRSLLEAFAYRVEPQNEARPAGRWREVITCIGGAFCLAALVVTKSLNGEWSGAWREWSGDWQLWVLGGGLFLYGGYRLRQIAHARHVLEATPSFSTPSDQPASGHERTDRRAEQQHR
jgi:hypothetical protein